jgi:hypothetical protein
MSPNGIVAGGRERARRSPEYLTACAMIRLDVEAEYEPLLAEAGQLRSLWLRFQRRRRIEREIDELTPSRGLY